MQSVNLDEERKEKQLEKKLKRYMAGSVFAVVALFYASIFFISENKVLYSTEMLILAGLICAFLTNEYVGIAIFLCQDGGYFAATVLRTTIAHIPLASYGIMLITSICMLSLAYLLSREGAKKVEGVEEKKAGRIIMFGNVCILLANLGFIVFLPWVVIFLQEL